MSHKLLWKYKWREKLPSLFCAFLSKTLFLKLKIPLREAVPPTLVIIILTCRKKCATFFIYIYIYYISFETKTVNIGKYPQFLQLLLSSPRAPFSLESALPTRKRRKVFAKNPRACCTSTAADTVISVSVSSRSKDIFVYRWIRDGKSPTRTIAVRRRSAATPSSSWRCGTAVWPPRRLRAERKTSPSAGSTSSGIRSPSSVCSSTGPGPRNRPGSAAVCWSPDSIRPAGQWHQWDPTSRHQAVWKTQPSRTLLGTLYYYHVGDGFWVRWEEGGP